MSSQKNITASKTNVDASEKLKTLVAAAQTKHWLEDGELKKDQGGLSMDNYTGQTSNIFHYMKCDQSVLRKGL